MDEVTQEKLGASFAFVMDTRPCDGAVALSRGVDLLVAESTYGNEDATLAKEQMHMTAAEAAGLARDADARGTLVLTHFSQRYKSAKPLVDEARAVFPRCTAVRDLDHVELPRH